jgi:hypothetical protein
MAVTLNALTTGVGGLQTTGDTSGEISLQSNGSTVVAVTASGVSITGTLSSTSALPAASGGTGLTSAGSNGNVLTSNGTTWTSAAPATSVTSLNGQTGAITNTSLYAIGSYITGRPANATSYAVDATIAGSSLYSTTGQTAYLTQFIRNLAIGGAAPAGTNTLINTGTWRCVSPAAGDATYGYAAGLWVRIS